MTSQIRKIEGKQIKIKKEIKYFFLNRRNVSGKLSNIYSNNNVIELNYPIGLEV